jgi:hypothetical protein
VNFSERVRDMDGLGSIMEGRRFKREDPLISDEYIDVIIPPI